MPSEVPFSFGAAYETDAFYPGDLATITDPFVLRSTRGVTIVVNPYQYNPVTKVLRVYEGIQTKVVVDNSEIGINELEAREENSAAFAQVYENLYLNNESALTRYTPREEEGEMLIISTNSFMDEIEPLVNWKNQEGIKTTLINRNDVGTTDTEIKSYIEDFYNDNPDLVFVLLVGDHHQIPAHSYGESGWEELWSDSYYGQMSGDFYPELFIGRFSGNGSNIETMVERTLEYEKNPAEGDWMAKAVGLASDEGYGYGDDGEADWQHARNNREKLLTYGYSEVFEFYDGSQGGADAPGNPNSSDILPVVNDGVGLFNYTGHGSEDVCVTGNFSSGNINEATNNDAYPFVVSVACNNGTFTAGTCISEVWMNATNGGSPTGSIAACGSTILMAWAEPMETQDEMANIISETYESNRKATLGGLFYNAQMSMLEDYGASSTAKEVMQTWVMFGDPSTLFRNQETQELTATHVEEVLMGITSVTVNCDVEDARVAISQNGILLGSAKVVGGSADISFDPIDNTAPLMVVATKQNYSPYIGEITVANGYVGIDEEEVIVSVYPNPADEMFTVTWGTNDTPSLITLHDLSGKVAYTSTALSGNNEVIRTDNLAPGIYSLSVTIEGKTNISKLVIR